MDGCPSKNLRLEKCEQVFGDCNHVILFTGQEMNSLKSTMDKNINDKKKILKKLFLLFLSTLFLRRLGNSRPSYHL